MEKYYGWGLPIDISSHGARIDRVIIWMHWGIAALFIGWLIFLVIALVKFKARPGVAANPAPQKFRFPPFLDAGIAAAEIAILFGISVPLWIDLRRLPPPADSVQIQVVAEQFAWNVRYPGPDGVFGRTDVNRIEASNPVGLDPEDLAAKDDLVVLNEMHVPAGRPVVVRLSSKDVIHSFGVPVLRVKQDVIPGQIASIWFEAKKTGRFEIACSQLCGLGHYRMKAAFIAETPEEFARWLAQAGAPAS